MEKRSAGGVKRRSASARDGAGWLRASLYVFALALVLALGAGARPVSAATTELDCSVVLGRECSMTEELAFCVINAYFELQDCEENGGLVNDIGCYGEYLFDFYACFIELPGTILLN